jgi:hypothetical protein
MDERGSCVKPASEDAGIQKDAGGSSQGLGTPCNAAQPCKDDVFAECHESGGKQLCTLTQCEDHSECGEGYCDLDAKPTFCRPLPTGQGKACKSDKDCAGFEASYCTVKRPGAPLCVVTDCTPMSCTPGYSCLDLSQFTPGLPKACVPPLM